MKAQMAFALTDDRGILFHTIRQRESDVRANPDYQALKEQGFSISKIVIQLVDDGVWQTK